MAQIDFDPSGVKASEGFDGELLPAGKYLAIVTASDVKPTADKTGQLIELEETIQQEGYRGRKVWTRLNIRNKNPVAEKIGQQELKQLMDAIGIGDRKLTDTAHLHGRLHVINVGVEKDATGKYPDKNNIKSFLPADKAAATPAVQRPAGPPAAAAPAPWQRPTTTAATTPAAPAQQPVQQPAMAGGEQPAHQPATSQTQAQQPAQQPAAANVPPWMRRA